jgi:hypothetical protein
MAARVKRRSLDPFRFSTNHKVILAKSDKKDLLYGLGLFTRFLIVPNGAIRNGTALASMDGDRM